ncbi:MAG: hypothetical protein GWP05_08045 [Anaerolineaceae bacterium]|nr:hypothetical protein [Anaerolineaceae bacterium]
MLMPAPMKRVNLFILEKDERAVTRALGQLRLMHLMPAGAESQAPLQHRPQQEQHLESNRRLLLQIDQLLAALDLPSEGPEAQLPHKTPSEIADRLRDIETRVDEMSRQLQRCDDGRKRIEELLRNLEAFVGLGVPIERLNNFSFLHFAIGSLPRTSLVELETEVGENVVLLPRDKSEDQQRIVAVTSKKGRFALETALEKAGFEPQSPGESMTGLAEQLTGDAERQLERLHVQREMAERMRNELAEKCGPELRVYHRTLTNENRIIEARGNFAYTDAACYITGWVPADQVNELSETVLGKTGGRAAIEILDPPPDSEPPSKFSQHPLLRPFSMLVAGYGFPKYREIEPTLFVAISFLMMFGFMFGDVGHGAVLLLAGLAMKLKAKHQKMQDIGVILMACGVSSMTMGVLVNSYFGFRPLRGLIAEPIENAMPIMTYSIIGGAVMISIGLVFNIINRLRARDISHGIFDKFGLVGAVIYWVVLWAAAKVAVSGFDSVPVKSLLVFIIICMVMLFVREPLLIFLKRRKGEAAESLLEATITAGVEIMEIFTTYLANTMSFIRLAAYAVSHAALLMTTFEMVKLVREIPTVGEPLSWLMFVVCTVIIIVLEGLVASIQAVRLEYYEFFGKFFSGMGRAYRPFEAE